MSAIFCGINPGRASAAAGQHFANPRNDFWRLLHDAGFTPRLLVPAEQLELPGLGYGLTNAAYRTTPGSGDLRRSDFEGSAARLAGIAEELRPGLIAFVGKEAYRGAFGERPQLGLQDARSVRRGCSCCLRPRRPTRPSRTPSACTGSGGSTGSCSSRPEGRTRRTA